MTMRRKFLFLSIAITWLCFLNPAHAKDNKNLSAPKLIVFYSPTCHNCAEIKEGVIPDIEKEFKGRISVEYLDITVPANYLFLLSLKEKYNNEIEVRVPLFFFEGRFLLNSPNIKNELREALLKGSIGHELNLKTAPQKGLIERFRDIKPFAIVAAGLIDGINPCAFTVIIFFMSFLVLQGYRRKQITITGLSFISAVFLTYLLLGLGIFNFLYSMSGFWKISRIVNALVGVTAIIFGLLAFLDALAFRNTENAENTFLKLPVRVKNRIHAIIGLHYRKEKDAPDSHIRLSTARLIASGMVTGILVSLLEAVCTGQIYLPVITLVLKTSKFKLEALGYFLLYNLMFIFPLLAIFILATLGVSSEGFSKFFRKHFTVTKFLMSAIFIALGILLIAR